MQPQATDQARRLHRAVTELVRRYQFRDRNEICCFGVSVSQCHALEALGQAGELTMGELASQMHLSVSTMTRVVDQLVARGLAQRGEDAKDRRVCWWSQPQGRELLGRISADLLGGETAILARSRPKTGVSDPGARRAVAGRGRVAWRGATTRRELLCRTI
jgi:DNA-binding MarR family transcriptional regulator